MTDTRSVATPEHESSGVGSRAGRLRALLSRIGLYYRQVVAELRKVIWPTRKELVTYTVVALTFVIFMTALVTSLDYGFTKLMFWIFG